MALLLETKTLLGAPVPTTSNKDATRGSWPDYKEQGCYSPGHTASNKDATRGETIVLRLEAIALRVEAVAIAIRLEAIAHKLEAIAITVGWLEPIGLKLKAIARHRY